jgi:acetolactate synthase-1/2/3 large subunit
VDPVSEAPAASSSVTLFVAPAATLLHLGPGMANGLANNTQPNKASTPMVNIVGDHAPYHRRDDAPPDDREPRLAAEIAGVLSID